MKKQRSIGYIGLTFMAVSGMLGSGWLFAPYLVGQIAGPAGVLSWLIGAAIMTLIALCYAEIGAMLPVAGGLARVPWFSHGNVVSAIMGWSAWLGYAGAAPIETLVLLRYLGPDMPFLFAEAGSRDLSILGYLITLVILCLMVLINAFGVVFFTRINSTLTWFKIAAPLVVGAIVMLTRFDTSNFTEYGFMPTHFSGVVSAVASGGVAFAFIGFRHAIDMAGETRNPQRNIPLALISAIGVCTVVYCFIQIAFVGGVSNTALADGWSSLEVKSNLGPFEAIAIALGMPFLLALIYGSAIIAPFGGGLVSTASNARLTYAMAQTGVFPRFFNRLSATGIPLNGLIVNLIAGYLFVLFIDFTNIVSLGSAAIVFSFIIGPISLYSFRLQIPDQKRSFKLQAAPITACVAFIFSGWILYWSGWETIRILSIGLVAGALVFIYTCITTGVSLRRDLDLRAASWLPAYMIVMAILSYLGPFAGGRSVIPYYVGIFIIAFVSTGFFAWAIYLRLDATRVSRSVAAAMRDE